VGARAVAALNGQCGVLTPSRQVPQYRAVRYVSLILLVYVTLDFANPLMPGAVSFSTEESVEGASRNDRAHVHSNVGVLPVQSTPLPDPDVARAAVSTQPPGFHDLRRSLLKVPRRTSAEPSPSSGASEDH
jgi:hypothetical protein